MMINPVPSSCFGLDSLARYTLPMLRFHKDMYALVGICDVLRII